MCAYIRTALRSAILFVVTTFSFTLVANAQLGIAAGYGLNVISQPSYSGQSNDFSSPGALNVALFYNFPMGQLDIRPSIATQKNDFDWELDGVEIFSPIKGDYRVAKIGIDLRYRFTPVGNTAYAIIGPEINFIAANRAELRQVLKYESGSTKYYGLNLGVGYRFEVSGVAFEPELRYSQALGGFMNEDFIVRTVSYDGDDERGLSNLTLRLGISFASFN